MCKLDNQQLVEFRLSYFSIISQNPARDVFSQSGSRFEAVEFKNCARQVRWDLEQSFVD